MHHLLERNFSVRELCNLVCPSHGKTVSLSPSLHGLRGDSQDAREPGAVLEVGFHDSCDSERVFHADNLPKFREKIKGRR